jgi:hypothetical protein
MSTTQARSLEHNIYRDLQRLPIDSLEEGDLERHIGFRSRAFDDAGMTDMVYNTVMRKLPEIQSWWKENNPTYPVLSVGDVDELFFNLQTLHDSNPERFRFQVERWQDEGWIGFGQGTWPEGKLINPEIGEVNWTLDEQRQAEYSNGARVWDNPNRIVTASEITTGNESPRFGYYNVTHTWPDTAYGTGQSIYWDESYPEYLTSIPLWMMDKYKDVPMDYRANHPILNDPEVYEAFEHIMNPNGTLDLPKELSSLARQNKLYQTRTEADWWARGGLSMGWSPWSTSVSAGGPDEIVQYEYQTRAGGAGAAAEYRPLVQRPDVPEGTELWETVVLPNGREFMRWKGYYEDDDGNRIVIPEPEGLDLNYPGGRIGREGHYMTHIQTPMDHALSMAIMIAKNPDENLDRYEVKTLRPRTTNPADENEWLWVEEHYTTHPEYDINFELESMSEPALRNIYRSMEKNLDTPYFRGHEHVKALGRFMDQEDQAGVFDLMKDSDGDIRSVWGFKGELGQKIDALVGLTISYNLLGLNRRDTRNTFGSPGITRIQWLAEMDPQEFWNGGGLPDRNAVSEEYKDKWLDLQRNFTRVWDSFSHEERMAIHYGGIGDSPELSKYILFKQFVLEASDNIRFRVSGLSNEIYGIPKGDNFQSYPSGENERAIIIEKIEEAMTPEMLEYRELLKTNADLLNPQTSTLHKTTYSPAETREKIRKTFDNSDNWFVWLTDDSRPANPDGSPQFDELFDRQKLLNAWDWVQRAYKGRRNYYQSIGMTSPNDLFSLMLQNTMYRGTNIKAPKGTRGTR